MVAISIATVLTPFFKLPYFGSGAAPAGPPTTLNRSMLAAAAAAADAAEAAAEPVNMLLLLPLLAPSPCMNACTPRVPLLLLPPTGELLLLGILLPVLGLLLVILVVDDGKLNC